MRKGFVVKGCILMVFLGLSSCQPHIGQENKRIDFLVDQISAEKIEAHIDELTNRIGARDTTVTQSHAADYIAGKLTEYGYGVTRVPVDDSGSFVIYSVIVKSLNSLYGKCFQIF